MSAGPDTTHGKGAKAARRQRALLTAKRNSVGLSFAESTRRMQLERGALLAAEQSERYSEARIFRDMEHMAARNPHE